MVLLDTACVYQCASVYQWRLINISVCICMM